MEENQIISDFEVLKSIKDKIEAEVNETNYASYRNLLESSIQDYNRIMTDVRIKQIILKNRRLAVEAKQALEEVQNYLIDYCKSIKVFPPSKIELLPVPEVSEEKKKEALRIWSHVASLEPAFKKAEELYDAVREGYKMAEPAKYSFSDWLDTFNDNAKSLVDTALDPELQELVQENKNKVQAALDVLKIVSFWLHDLNEKGLYPPDLKKIELFNELMKIIEEKHVV